MHPQTPLPRMGESEGARVRLEGSLGQDVNMDAVDNLLSRSASAAASAMAARLEHKLRNHQGERGEMHEEDLRALLRDFLPRRFEVAPGEVITAGGDFSAQHDILIWDSMTTPVINRSPDSVLLPYEGCLMAVEVTTTLTAKKLKTDAAKIHRLKDLHVKGAATDVPTGFIFGYRSASLNSLVETIDQLEHIRDGGNRVDSIISMQRGVVTNFMVIPGEAGRVSSRATDGYSRMPLFSEKSHFGEGFHLAQTLLLIYGALRHHALKRGSSPIPMVG